MQCSACHLSVGMQCSSENQRWNVHLDFMRCPITDWQHVGARRRPLAVLITMQLPPHHRAFTTPSRINVLMSIAARTPVSTNKQTLQDNHTQAHTHIHRDTQPHTDTHSQHTHIHTHKHAHSHTNGNTQTHTLQDKYTQFQPSHSPSTKRHHIHIRLQILTCVANPHTQQHVCCFFIDLHQLYIMFALFELIHTQCVEL